MTYSWLKRMFKRKCLLRKPTTDSATGNHWGQRGTEQKPIDAQELPTLLCERFDFHLPMEKQVERNDLNTSKGEMKSPPPTLMIFFVFG